MNIKGQVVLAGSTRLVLIAGLFFGSMLVSQAQTQSIQEVVSAAQALAAAQPVADKTVPVYSLTTASPPGTYWRLQLSQQPPLPFSPFPGLPVYPLGNGNYAVDDRSVFYPGLEAQLSAQAAASRQAMTMDLSGVPSPGDGGGGSGYGGVPLYEIPSYTTNQLWLSIISVTNAIASLVIHPPSSVTNGVYDLLYSTNLTTPFAGWQWLLRTDAGQTNLVVPNAADAQGFYRIGPPNDLSANDSLGTNFWVAFFNTDYYYSYADPKPSLYISSPVGATGTVTIPGLGFTNAFSVGAEGVTNISIPSYAMISNYDVVEMMGIHITSTQPVAAYAVNYRQYISAAFTCYPLPLLGTNYCVMARAPGILPPDYISNCSQLVILATASNTTVHIYPSPTADLAVPSGTNSYTLTNLQAGDTYQINGSNLTNDVTGTFITSDQPIAVFAGADLADVPANVASGNPLVQEQLPVDSWGTQALALSFAGRTNGDSYRVLAASNNTVVTISGIVVTVDTNDLSITTSNGVVVVTNQAGQFYDIIVEGPVEFQASQPIQVAHFANGRTFDTPDGGEGDPCEILLPPTGHYLQTNTVYTSPHDEFTQDFDQNYLNIIVVQSGITNILVDNSPVAITNFVSIGTSGYYGAQLSMTSNGVHTVTSSQPVGVEVYGFGPADAYGYFGGVVK